MTEERDALDPRGLISEAYRIEGITEPDCRSIFFDWALGLDPEANPRDAIEALLARHAAEQPDDHPMTQVLREGLAAPARARRGRRRRDAGDGGSDDGGGGGEGSRS